MSIGIRALTLRAGAVAFGPQSFGQDTPVGLSTFRSDTQLVLTGFHIVVRKRNVTGLTASDFQLLVDGRPRTIATFERGGGVNTPVEIVLVFDSSGSVHGAGLVDERLFRDNLLADLPEVTLIACGSPSPACRCRRPGRRRIRRLFRPPRPAGLLRFPQRAEFPLREPRAGLRPARA